jgi:small-conductance mechanosensitive channel
VNPDNLIAGLQAEFAWAPPWTVSIAVAVVALALAQVAYGAAVRGVRHALARRNEFWRSLVVRTRGPARLALALAALSWSVHAAPFPPGEGALIQHGLLMIFIVLCGWAALTALDIAAALYLRRYQIDTPDNLLARKHLTQVRILRRASATLIVLLTAGLALMTIPGVRQLGVSLLAAGGAAGIILGLALQPLLSNLLAGVQIALTQPIRIDDAVIVEGEWGRVEEIGATYVVVRIWDLRRMVLPLKYFIEHPFQNWTRTSAELMGTAMLYLDYRTPVEAVRRKLDEIVKASPKWDGKVAVTQVTDLKERTMEVRCLVSAADSGSLFDLRCEVREKLIAWLQAERPEALPRDRLDLRADGFGAARSPPGPGGAGERIQ